MTFSDQHRALIDEVVRGDAMSRLVQVGVDESLEADGQHVDTPLVLLPGSFNPLHEGHRQMADVAASILGTPTHFELSVVNVDKPPLTSDQVGERLADFPPATSLWVTRAPKFTIKATLFPRATFVVGVDTITRIADLRYYQDDRQQFEAAIAKLAAHGCRFLVFGRVADGRFQTLDGLGLPEPLRSLCDGVDEDAFRCDLSSTAIRDQ